jgi:hypothetical protein
VSARVDADLELIVTLNDGALRQLALDAAGLSPDSLAAVSALVQQLRRVEGSPSLLAQTTTSADEPARSRRRRAHGGQGRRTHEAPPPA